MRSIAKSNVFLRLLGRSWVRPAQPSDSNFSRIRARLNVGMKHPPEACFDPPPAILRARLHKSLFHERRNRLIKEQAILIRASFVVGVVCTAVLAAGNTVIAGGQAASPDSVQHASIDPNVSVRDSGNTPQHSLAQRNPRYIIQRQDVLSLSFPLSSEMNQTVTVQPDGYINLQNGGSLHVQGFTVPEVMEGVKHAYESTLHNPIVIVDLKDFQKPFYTVSGQVAKPGQYELRADITVAEALAVAGGLAPTAKSQIFLFHRTSEQWFEVTKVNMKDLMRGKNINEASTLRPGDMIYVPESFISNFRKYVPYSLSAGSYLSNGTF